VRAQIRSTEDKLRNRRNRLQQVNTGVAAVLEQLRDLHAIRKGLKEEYAQLRTQLAELKQQAGDQDSLASLTEPEEDLVSELFHDTEDDEESEEEADDTPDEDELMDDARSHIAGCENPDRKRTAEQAALAPGSPGPTKWGGGTAHPSSANPGGGPSALAVAVDPAGSQGNAHSG
jgi:chromosome segregation ATPase